MSPALFRTAPDTNLHRASNQQGLFLSLLSLRPCLACLHNPVMFGMMYFHGLNQSHHKRHMDVIIQATKWLSNTSEINKVISSGINLMFSV